MIDRPAKSCMLYQIQAFYVALIYRQGLMMDIMCDLFEK